MSNPFKDSEFISVSGMHADGAIIVQATNSIKNMMIDSKGNDLFTSYSCDDAKLKSWLELDTKEKIDDYAEDTANQIKESKVLNKGAANIYSELFRQYFSKFCPVVQSMSKKYDCIRVFYNKMDEYIPIDGEETLKRKRNDEEYKKNWRR